MIIPKNKNNILIPWKPIYGIEKKMYIEAIHDDYEGFRILLKGEKPESILLRITFNDHLGYRNTDEGNLIKIWNPEKPLGIFFIVENSSYINYFHEMTLNIYKDWKIIHYAIYSPVDCIDILSSVPPIVEWLN